MLLQTPKLISFAVCPFVQRTQILLEAKGIAYDKQTIDLDNKPDWFLNRVPTGLVPALFVGEHTLFESAVINEFLDEVTPGSALPDDPVARAKARAWIKQSDGLIFDQYHMLAATTDQDYLSAREVFEAALAKFASATFAPASQTSDDMGLISMLDLSIAPVFLRMQALVQLGHVPFDVPRALLEWGADICARPEVTSVVSPRFTPDLIAFFGRRGSFAFGPAFADLTSHASAH